MNKISDIKKPLLAFTDDGGSSEVIKQFAAARDWNYEPVQKGNINNAIEFLKSNPSPQVLLVDVDSSETLPESLDALADVCETGTQVVVSGFINEYSFYSWLIDVGVSGYLLKPFKLAALESVYDKAVTPSSTQPTAAEKEVKSCKIISVLGSRGGVGTSTVCVNLAWILSKHFGHKTALLDFDPRLGTTALSLDLEAGRGLKDALEKPERIDGLFIDRVMMRVNDKLSVLNSEEALEERIIGNAQAGEKIIDNIKNKFEYIIIDVPRHLSDFGSYALSRSNNIICVSEYSLVNLRDCLRYSDYCKDILKVALPMFVANKVGLAGKYQMPKADFEKGLGSKVQFEIPFASEAYLAASTGELISETAKTNPMSKALARLGDYFLADGETPQQEKKSSGLLSLFKGKNT